MRRPRRQTPGARWFVTTRCAGACFRLRPDATRRDYVGFFLGRALGLCAGIQLHAAVQMSNHLHLVLMDCEGELSDFMREFLGPLAKAINRLDAVHGPLFERRYAATEIVDEAALVERIVYTLTNPVAANLVASFLDWPGLIVGPNLTGCQRFRRSRRPTPPRVNRSPRIPSEEVDRRAAFEEVEFEVTWNEEVAHLSAELELALEARQQALTAARASRSVLGRGAVLALDPFHSPERPKRRRMPLCHASTMELWRWFREGWRAFVLAYRQASAAFRRGRVDVTFPPHSYRPSTRGA